MSFEPATCVVDAFVFAIGFDGFESPEQYND
jgi:hypothetical protein